MLSTTCRPSCAACSINLYVAVGYRFPDDNEYVLMLRSIIDVNLCKFLSHDVPLFNGIVSDLFPGVTLPTPDYADLQAALRKQYAANRLQPTDYSMLKVQHATVFSSLQSYMYPAAV